jgi:hypothetical protein
MDAADQTLLMPAGAPVAQLRVAEVKPRRVAPAAPQMNRQERMIFSAYLVMIALIVAFLALTGAVAVL